MITTWLQKRDFSEQVALPESLEFRVDSYEFDEGGPKQATIQVSGYEADIWRAEDWLRCPIFIDDSDEGAAWDGYVAQIEITVGAMSVGLTLDEMTNRISVIYNPPSLYGNTDQAQTDWDQNDDSVSQYGIKERIYTLSDVPAAMAEARRAMALAQLGEPLPTIDTADSGAIQATLVCRGWRDTLGWRYYAQPAGYVAHDVSGDAQHKLGLGLTDTVIGFNAEKQRIHDLSARLGNFKKDDVIRVSGSTSNNAVYTVDQGTNKVAASVTASTISFGTVNVRSKLSDTARGLAVFPTGGNVTISGSGAGNNGTYVVKGSASDGSYLEFDEILADEGPGVSLTITRGATVYTAATITINSGAHPTIFDSAGGLGDLDAGDMISVSGAGGNSGYYFVESGDSDGASIVVSRAVTTAAAGPSITIQRGHSIEVVETLVDELPGATATVQIYGAALRQSFVPSTGGWTVGALGIRMRKVGSPSDGLKLWLYSNSSGNPGTALDSVTIAAADLPDSMDWVTGTLGNTVSLVAATTYHLVVSRTGALSATDYYEVSLDEELGDAGGSLGLNVGGLWNVAYTRTPDADMPYRVIGHREVTGQIEDLVAACGQFFAGVDVQATSGLATPQYRDGMTTADEELKDLLSVQTVDGGRLVARVNRQRWLVITAEPARPDPGVSAPYRVDRDGRLRDALGRLVPPILGVVGVWADIDVVPANVTTRRLAQISPVYIEGMTINPNTGTVKPRYRGSRSPFDLGGMRDG